MERLSCTSTVSYNATEAAIHMARYQIAAPYCKGKRILDVACGEGYGAYALLQLGAAAVDAVDNSQQAITNAKALFARRGVRFHLHDAETVDEMFPKAKFDVIVCLETIEHLRDPERFLRALKKVAKDDAVIVVTCPNDHWYYASEDQSNPFHVKKYSFEAFRDLMTGVLGNAAVWGYGAPVVGFGTVADELVAGKDPLLGQIAMLEFQSQASAIMLPPRGFSNIGPRNCSYFVGVWGGQAARIYTSAIVPMSMDHFSNLVSWETARLSPRRISELESERSTILADKLQLEHRTTQVQSEFSELQGRWRVLSQEVELTSRKFDQAREEYDKELELAGRTLDEVRKEHEKALDLARRTLDEARKEHARELELAGSALDQLRQEREKELELADKALDQVRREHNKERELAAQELEQLREKHRLETDNLVTERQRYRIQSFALAKEVDLMTAQIGEISAERDRHRVELDNARAQLLETGAALLETGATRDGYRVELVAAHEVVRNLAADQEQLNARLRAQEGLRYLVKATSKALRRRLISEIRLSVIRPARLAKAYLPAPVVSWARSIARRLRL